MAPFVLTNVAKLEEIISDMAFRDEAHIKISKAKREIAYTMAVDVYIDSIAWNLYENHNAEPSIKHYGYIQLVYQDAFSQIFPITQFRQRFYFAQQWEAMNQWKDWERFYQDYYFHNTGDDQRRSLATAAGIDMQDFPQLGITAVNLPFFAPQSKWIELPLREIHVKCQKNTQFTISYSQYQPVPFNDLIFGLFQPDGKSNQDDGDKDNGIPDNSIPKQNNPSSPFAGMPSPSTDAQIADNGFLPINPNDWESPPLRYVVGHYVRDYLNGCGAGLYEIFYQVGGIYLEPPVPNYQIVNSYTACGATPSQTVRILINGVDIGGSSGSSMNLFVIPFEGEAPPAGTFYGWRAI